MSTTYPASIDNSVSLPLAVDGLTPIKAAYINQLQAAIIAIEGALGVNPGGVYGSVASALTTLSNTVGNLQIISLAGDLGGTLANPLVVGLQGNPISTATPAAGQLLGWNGAAWLPVNPPATNINFGGDLTGSNISQTVVGIQGQILPTLSDGYLNWNGSAWRYSTISVPTSLPPSGSAGGDLNSTYPNPIVAAIQGNPVVSGALTSAEDGYILTVNSSNKWQALPPPSSQSGGAQNITLSNGLNSNVATNGSEFLAITGPTAAYSVGGLAPSQPFVGGQRVCLSNMSSQSFTIVNEDLSSTAANRFRTPNGLPYQIGANGSKGSAVAYYDATIQRLVITSNGPQSPIFINVVEYGIVGDGETDIGVALNNLMAAIPAYSELYFPPGVYRHSIPLWMPQALTLTGPRVWDTSYLGGQGGAIFSMTNLGFTYDWTGPLMFIGPSGTLPETPVQTSGVYCIPLGAPFVNNPGRPVLNFSDADVGCLSSLGSVGSGVGSGFTFEFYCDPQGNFPSTGNTYPLVASSGARYLWSVDQTKAFSINLLPAGQLQVIITTSANGQVYFYSAGTLPSNTLSHVAVCFNPSSGLKLFITTPGGTMTADTNSLSSSACTGVIIQQPYEDFTIGYCSQQWPVNGSSLGNAIPGPFLFGSPRISSEALYTTGSTAPTGELAPISSGANSGSTNIVVNFKPTNFAVNGLWIIGQSSFNNLSRHTTGDPVYLYMGYGVSYGNVIEGPTVRNIAFQTGAPTGASTGIFCDSTLYGHFEWCNMDPGSKCITTIGGYGYKVEHCTLNARYCTDFAGNYRAGGQHGWVFANYGNGGGGLNEINHSTFNAGQVTIVTTTGISVDQLFVNTMPEFMGIYCSGQAPDGIQLSLKGVRYDDEATSIEISSDCGLYCHNTVLATIRDSVWAGHGGSIAAQGSSSCVTYKLGSNGTVEIDDWWGNVNSSVPGIVAFIEPQADGFFNGQGIVRVLSPTRLYANGVPMLAPPGDGYYYVGPLVVPPWHQIGYNTQNFTSNADYTFAGNDTYNRPNLDAQHFGTLIMTDTHSPPWLSTARNVILPYLIPGAQLTVINNTLQTLTFKSATGTGVAVNDGYVQNIYCDGTNWNIG